jgi:RNA polymerase II-associated factor 1
MQAEKDRKRLFFVLRPKLGAFYNPLNGKITMRRKRAKSKHAREEVFEVPKKILLSKREFTGGEKTRRRVRLAEVAPLENMEEESDDE